MDKTILISACLIGVKCRYDGTAKEVPHLKELLKDYRLVPFCPESLGGLTIPRLPAEIQGGDGAQVLAGVAHVRNQSGQDLTAEFIRGARMVLAMAELYQPDIVVAKAKSPSCGAGRIYDGSFTGKLSTGDGVTIALLRQAGFVVYSETDLLNLDSASTLRIGLKNPNQILEKNNG